MITEILWSFWRTERIDASGENNCSRTHELTTNTTDGQQQARTLFPPSRDERGKHLHAKKRLPGIYFYSIHPPTFVSKWYLSSEWAPTSPLPPCSRPLCRGGRVVIKLRLYTKCTYVDGGDRSGCIRKELFHARSGLAVSHLLFSQYRLTPQRLKPNGEKDENLFLVFVDLVTIMRSFLRATGQQVQIVVKFVWWFVVRGRF